MINKKYVLDKYIIQNKIHKYYIRTVLQSSFLIIINLMVWRIWCVWKQPVHGTCTYIHTVAV
jgi:hypothetical protein